MLRYLNAFLLLSVVCGSVNGAEQVEREAHMFACAISLLSKEDREAILAEFDVNNSSEKQSCKALCNGRVTFIAEDAKQIDIKNTHAPVFMFIKHEQIRETEEDLEALDTELWTARGPTWTSREGGNPRISCEKTYYRSYPLVEGDNNASTVVRTNCRIEKPLGTILEKIRAAQTP